MKNLSFLFLIAAIFTTLSGCGSSSNLVQITLQPNGFENNRPEPNLMRSLFTVGKPTIGHQLTASNSCLQANLMLGSQVGADTEDKSNINVSQAMMRTPIVTAAPPDMVAFLAANATFDQPPTVAIPGGQIAQAGLIGSIVVPFAADASGNCAVAPTGSPNTPYATYSVTGHKIITSAAAVSGTLPINVWIVPAVAFSSTIGSLYCDPLAVIGNANGDPAFKDNQLCPKKDFVEITVPGADTFATSKPIVFGYFYGGNNGGPAYTNMAYSDATSNGHLLIPNTFPLTTNFFLISNLVTPVITTYPQLQNTTSGVAVNSPDGNFTFTQE